MGFGMFTRLKDGLEKTRQGLVGQVKALVTRSSKLDEDFFEQLEETLILADVGVETTMALTGQLREETRTNRLKEPADVMAALKHLLLQTLRNGQTGHELTAFPAIWMVVGVNGVGKTTTIGKLAARLRREGRRVVLGAGDTFRAAAIDQIEVWSKRAGCDLIRHREGSDPAAVAFDTIQAARARRADVAIIDTAGRLHTKSNLMDELKKVHRVITREAGEYQVRVLLVLDAATGQNAISQARIFKEAVQVDGVALTKLDGTAKGGIVIAIADNLRLPVRYVGVGEAVDDLQDFEAESFIEALFG